MTRDVSLQMGALIPITPYAGYGKAFAFILTDGKSIPLSVAVDGANRHDKKLIKATLDSIVIERPPPEETEQNICMDKGYDYPDIRELVDEYGYTAYIRSGGEENKEKNKYWAIEQEDG